MYKDIKAGACQISAQHVQTGNSFGFCENQSRKVTEKRCCGN